MRKPAMTPLVISEFLLVVVCVAVIVAAFRFRPRYFAPARIKQDRTRQVVVIDGAEFSGWITKRRCDKCRERLIYHEQYDEDFCPKCNEWTRSEPSDWEFKRPDRPLPILKK